MTEHVNNVITLTDADAEARRAELKVTPQAEDLNNEAAKLKKALVFDAAYIAQLRAVRLCPESGWLHMGLAGILWNLGRMPEALAESEKAIELMPDSTYPLSDYGQILSSLGRKEEALAVLKRGVELRPDDKQVKWTYSMVLLDHGEWDEGFKQYECRPDFRGKKYYPNMPFPMWNGEELDGKTLYIQAEQGVGDRILQSRYLAWIKERWPTSRVMFLASSPEQTNLESLLWNYHTEYGIEFLHPQIPWPKADYGCFQMSLPRIHGTRPDNIPPDPGCIRRRMLPDSAQVEIPEPLTQAIKVGISWTGNPAMTRNIDRTIPASLMFELETDPLVQLYSLQFHDRSLHTLRAEQIICDVAADIGDRGFCGTAAAMLHLDLIITCCTGNAHLAGALGVPTWVLLCHDPYWVWMRGREDSPWYPSVRLFRQKTPGDWREVIERVKTELHAFAKRKLNERGADAPVKERSHG